MQHSKIRLGAILLIVLPIRITGICAETGVRQTPSQIANLANVTFQNDARIFAVMAALNLAGFDHETEDREMSEVRLRVREHLQKVPAGLKTRIQSFFRERQALLAYSPQPQVAYTSLALLLSGPPNFQLEIKESEMPRDVLMVQGFEHLVREVYEVGHLEQLWQELQPHYVRELAIYEPIMQSVIRETLDFFRIPARIALDRQIRLTPDLLDVKEIVNARNLETIYYIVIGPADEPLANRFQLRHEYLHFLLDPLLQKFSAGLLRHDELLDLAQRQPGIRQDYQNKLTLVATESLVDAVQLRMDAPESEEETARRLVKHFRDGLILAPYFHRELQDFAKSELISLPAYIESMIQGIDPDEIRLHEKEIYSLEQSFREKQDAERAALQKQIDQANRRNKVIELFNDAESKMRADQLDEAKTQLYEVLRLEPNYGNAFFYLAQISFQRQELEDAIRNYQLTITSDGVEPAIRARSRLVIGKIKAYQQKFEEAREIFQQIATLKGDLQGAPEEAKRLLELLPPASQRQ